MKKGIMDWKICIEDYIKKIEPDKEKIISIVRMCNERLDFIKDFKFDDNNAFIVATNYYEIIKELLTALLIKNGMKSTNHECLISFFKYKFPEYEYESKIMHQLKDVRNKASYEGVFVKKSYVEMNKLEFEHIITLLKKLIIGDEANAKTAGK